MPNQTDPNKTTGTTNVPPVSVQHTDLPPLPDFMTVPTPKNSPTSPPLPVTPDPQTTPPDLPPMVSTPKKRFGRGKIIATILGLLLLVGGVGAGVVLTQQQQIFKPKAYSCGCSASGHNASGFITSCSSNAGADCPGGSSPICYIQNQGTASNYCSCGCHAGGGCTPNQTQPCGNGGTQVCVNGSWGDCTTPACTAPKTTCGGNCVDLQTDGSNCGSCGHGCGGGGCSNGSCIGGGTACSAAGADCGTTNCCTDTSLTCKSITGEGKRCEMASCDCDPVTDTAAIACNIDAKSGKKKCVAKAGTTTGHCGGWGPCTPDGNPNCSGLGGTCKTACAATGEIENDTTDCQAAGGKVCCRPSGGGSGGGGGACSLSGTDICVGNVEIGDCYQGSTGGQYACYKLKGNPGQKVSSCSYDNANCNCSCPSSHTWLARENGAWWCFNTNTNCDGVSPYAERCSLNPQQCGSETPPPGTTPPTAPMCVTISAYDARWGALSTPQLSALAVGAQVNFCVSGSAPSGTFDKAQFTINGVQQAETTTVRPGSTDFCQSYNIQATDTTVNVTAKIHHSTLGWY